MKDNNLHQSNNYPEDLKYSEANWEMALGGIEAHDKKVRNKRIAGLISGICLLALIFFVYEYSGIENTNEIAQKQTIRLTDSKQDKSVSNGTEPLKITIENEGKSSTKTQMGKELTSSSIISTTTNDDTNNNNIIEEIGNDQNKKPSLGSNYTNNKEADYESVTDYNSNSNNAKSSKQKSKPTSITDSSEKEKRVKAAIYNSEKHRNIALSNVDQARSNNSNNEVSPKINANSSVTGSSSSINNNTKFELPKKEISDYNSDKTNPMKGRYASNGQLDFKLVPLTPKRSNKIQLKHDYLASKKPQKSYYNIQPQSIKPFYIPYESFSLKISASPWVNYGKNNYWNGINPAFGLEYERNGTNSISWRVGVNYFTVSELPLVLERTETSYGYGYERIVTSVETDQLQFVSLPIQFSYRILDRVQVFGGVGMSYLVAAKNTLKKTKYTDTSTELLSSEENNNYIQGFNRSSYYGLLGANLWITEKLSFGAAYQLGLTDFSIDKEFNEVVVHNNSKFELSIKRIIR